MISILSLCFFTACGPNDLDNFKDEPEITSINGILQELSINDNIKGSFKLKTENNEFVGLRSLTIKLGSKQYLDNKVTLFGLMNDEDEVFEVTGVKINEILSQDSYKGKFVEYKNSDLNFKLKYYDDWTVVEGNTAVVFYPNDDKDLATIDKEEIKISKEDYFFTNTTLEESDENSQNNIIPETPLSNYYNTYYISEKQTTNIINISSEIHKIGFDLIDALKFNYVDGMVEFKTYRPGFIYTLSYKPGVTSNNKQVFNEMVSEFQFIASTMDAIDSPFVDPSIFNDTDQLEVVTENSGNKNYSTSSEFYDYIPFESSLYSFTALMPDDWYYAGSSSSDGNVLHHYAFSDSPLDESLENEILGLDIISSDIPDGEVVIVNNVEIIFQETSSKYFAYRNLGSFNFRISGNKFDDIYDVILTMSASIENINESDIL